MAISSSNSIVKLNLKSIEALKGFLDKVLSDADLRKQVTGSENNFIRNRKLPLCILAGFILNMVKRSLSVEIQDFFPGQTHINLNFTARMNKMIHFKSFCLKAGGLVLTTPLRLTL